MSEKDIGVTIMSLDEQADADDTISTGKKPCPVCSKGLTLTRWFTKKHDYNGSSSLQFEKMPCSCSDGKVSLEEKDYRAYIESKGFIFWGLVPSDHKSEGKLQATYSTKPELVDGSDSTTLDGYGDTPVAAYRAAALAVLEWEANQ